MTQRKPIIGLAGGIGSGKSLVARQMASLGCAVIDSDDLARAVLDEEDIRRTLVQWWGDRVLDGQDRVDRQVVGGIVFADAAQLARLEALVHPRVHERREQLRHGYQRDAQVRAIVEDAPLLFEAGINRQCDVVVFVRADESTRLARVAKHRDWSAQEMHDRESRQLPLDFKRDHADYVVDNDGDEAETFSHVRRVLSEIFHRFS